MFKGYWALWGGLGFVRFLLFVALGVWEACRTGETGGWGGIRTGAADAQAIYDPGLPEYPPML